MTDVDLGLANKWALVTGSTAGIGFATAERLAQEGASVIVNGRSEQRVTDAVRRLRVAVPGAIIEGVAADVSGAEGCGVLSRAYPNVDILVNNMGIFEPKAFDAISDEEWFRFFEANVMSGIRLSRYYLAGMRARNWGRIVFVSSESGLQIPVEMIHYGMTKTAQLAVARGLAESLAGTNVTVNSVLPGPTASEGVTKFVADLAASQHKDPVALAAEFVRTSRPSSIIQRLATPTEVANLIVYVCGAQASATTGASLRVDGGVVRSIA